MILASRKTGERWYVDPDHGRAVLITPPRPPLPPRERPK